MWELLVLYEGAWVDILPKSNNLSWSSNKDNLAVELNFDSIYDLEVGTYVSLMKEGKEIFRTILVKKNEKRTTFSYNCFDYMWYLNKSKLIMQFNDIAASDAIKQICDKEDIKCNIADMSTKIKKVYKQECSSIIEDIMKQVYEETATEYIKYIDVNVFTIKKLEDLYIYPKFLLGGDMTITQSMEEMKNSVVVTCTEKEITAGAKATKKKGKKKVVKKRLTNETTDGDNIAKYGLLQDIIEVNNKNYSQAQNLANNLLEKYNKIQNEVEVSIIALEKGEEIVANRYIYIKDESKGLDNWLLIKSATHTLQNGLHKVHLTLEVTD